MKQLIILLILITFNVPVFAKCENCTDSENTIYQLNTVSDVVKKLKEIRENSEELDKATLEYYLSTVATSAEVNALLATKDSKSSQKIKVTATSNKTLLKTKKPAPKKVYKVKASQKKGVDGILVAHAQSANDEIGFKASATIVINGKPHPLLINSTFEHNNNKYKLIGVEEVEKANGRIAHLVHIKNTKSGNEKTLPWQL